MHFPINTKTQDVAIGRHGWSRAFARAIAPRKHLRVLPTRTRPSLFGSD